MAFSAKIHGGRQFEVQGNYKLQPLKCAYAYAMFRAGGLALGLGVWRYTGMSQVLLTKSYLCSATLSVMGTWGPFDWV